MKKIIILLAATLIVFACSKDNEKKDEQQTTQENVPVSLGTQFAALANGVYNSSDLKGKPFLYLTKGEEVELLEEIETTDKNNKAIVVFKIKTTGEKEGFVNSRYFGIKRIVITDDTVPVYSRNNETSTPSSALHKGTTAIVTKQMGDWYQIIAWQTPDEKEKTWNKWIKSGFSEEKDLFIDALQLEQAKILFNKAMKSEESNRKPMLDKTKIILDILENSSYDFIKEEAVKMIETIENPESSESSNAESTDSSDEESADPDQDNIEPIE